MPLQSPVLFLIFNRPDKTKQVFEAIRKAKPSRLFVAADGARKDKTGEQALCEQTRDIVKAIDWECELKTLFRDENLGCKMAVSGAINWFFEHVEEGIILEDDCLPNQSFFDFCQNMLSYYQDDERIMHIGGSNFQDGQRRGDGSYYFSNYNHIWGWATWKRAWSKYDIKMQGYDEFESSNYIHNLFRDKRIASYWLDIFKKVKANEINTWDYQWTFSIWTNHGLSVLPNKNLIQNIGFDEEGTHTSANNYNNIFAKRGLDSLSEKLVHPKNMLVDNAADSYSMEQYFYPSVKKFILNKLKQKIYSN